MRAMITGAGGFIGSTLTDRMLRDGHEVVGVDCFTDYYDVAQKRSNLTEALTNASFTLIEQDLALADLAPLLDGIDVVYHLAGQPGVRLSWSDGFAAYVERNITATQRLLEASKNANLSRFVYASSSSVYGNAERYPTSEHDLPQPHSPYGVTKLAGEHLCSLYAANWAMPTVSLRYFTVYGPRQRPDMAHHRLIKAALEQTPFPMYGDGAQERSFTFVEDVVDATFNAGVAEGLTPGVFFNVAGSETHSLRNVIDLVGEAVGQPVPIERLDSQPGDADKTGGDASAIKAAFGWEPKVSLKDGIAAQVAYHRTALGL
ncbi:MAG: NAD-dependent epimerase/dehydratase family protein [Actinobacteria bacterium]|nr:NAD-dependent epimerase/dehydratase family protein [Actinomycetota bacterium]